MAQDKLNAHRPSCTLYNSVISPADKSKSADGKRRLPIVGAGSPPSTESDGGADPERPPWQWVLIGVTATFLAWLIFAAAAGAIVRRLTTETSPSASVWLMSAHGAAFFVSGFLGGFLVGRLAPKPAHRMTASVGAITAITAWLIAATQGTPGGFWVWFLLLLLMCTLGAIASFAGGTAAKRARKAQATPPSPESTE
ncbi:MAG: hypothetical protein IPK82_22120 [Polyangiaceae bacterium]|nr:hypothetical protein [Polyangiaceae bacterium]